MNLSRRDFIGGVAASAAFASLPGFCQTARPGKVALHLSSIDGYISNFGLIKALKDVAAIGYKGVEFDADNIRRANLKEVKKVLDDTGLTACGLLLNRDSFSPDEYKKTCERSLSFGNNYIFAGHPGRIPKDKSKFDDFVKSLCDYYNTAAQNCASYGCKIGHFITGWDGWAFKNIMSDGATMYVDYFFSHADKAVQMGQDVAWTMSNGFDPCSFYKKHPGRSFSLRARDNGKPGILGRKTSSAAVNWDALFPVTDADGVQWYVVECERHRHVLSLVKQSFEFLKSKGRV